MIASERKALRYFIDALRAALGKDPLYAPVVSRSSVIHYNERDLYLPR